MKYFAALLIAIGLCFSVSAQVQPTVSTSTVEKPNPVVSSDSPESLAKAVVSAHGGDKFRTMKTLVVRGSVDITASALNQPLIGGFSMAYAGDKYRIELATPMQSFKQAFDGELTHSSIELGFNLPPMNRLGIPLLQHMGDKGFVVSKLPDTSKKKLGFRITAPDGFFTDYFVDEKTDQIKSYESQYEYSGRTFTTSVTIDKYRVIDGVTIPEKYSQRFDLGQLSIYGLFKAKDILVNTELAPEVFTNIN